MFIDDTLRALIREKADPLSQHLLEGGRRLGTAAAEQRLLDWCSNFDGFIEDCRVLVPVLRKLRFLRDDEILATCSAGFDGLPGAGAAGVVRAPLGELSESSARIMAALRGDPSYAETLVEAIRRCQAGEASAVLAIDDFLNTGRQFTQIVGDLMEGRTPGRLSLDQASRDFVRSRQIPFYFCFFMGTETGRREAELAARRLGIAGVPVVLEQYLDDRGIFGPPSTQHALANDHSRPGTPGDQFIFGDVPWDQVRAFHRICSAVGDQVNRQHKPAWSEGLCAQRALGYGNAAQLLVTEKNVPTITLTCLWRGGTVEVDGKRVEWAPLIERREKTIRGVERRHPLADPSPCLLDFGQGCSPPVDLVLFRWASGERPEGAPWADATGSFLRNLDHSVEPPDQSPDGLAVLRLDPTRYNHRQARAKIAWKGGSACDARIGSAHLVTVGRSVVACALRLQLLRAPREGRPSLEQVASLCRQLMAPSSGTRSAPVRWEHRAPRGPEGSGLGCADLSPVDLMTDILQQPSSPIALHGPVHLHAFVRTTGSLFSQDAKDELRRMARSMASPLQAAPERIPFLDLDAAAAIAVSERAAILLAGAEAKVNRSGWQESYLTEYLLVFVLALLQARADLGIAGFTGSLLADQLRRFDHPWFFEKLHLVRFAREAAHVARRR